MKKVKKLPALFLAFVVVFSVFSSAVVTVSAASALTDYEQYDPPETVGDYVYCNVLRTIKSSSTQVEEIKWIQAALNYCIEYKGLDASRVLVSNMFGPACKAAAIRFQYAVNGIVSLYEDKGLVRLVCDGKIDSATIKAMLIVLSDDSIHFKKTVTTTADDSGFKKQNILQYAVSETEMNTGDFIAGSWAGYSINGSYDIAKAGCGIVALVSAVYNLGGTIEKENIGKAITDVFDWAYGKHWYNAAYWSLFEASDEQFGKEFGYSVSQQYGGQGREATDLNPLVEHVKAGNTAVVHIYGHFFVIADYQQIDGNELLLVFDPAPGKGLSTKSRKRRYLTSASGSWISLDVIKNGAMPGILRTSDIMSLENLEVDAYWLISKTAEENTTS